MSNFVKNTTITFGSKVVSFIGGVGTSIILARLLGPEGKGIYRLAILLPTLVVTFTNFGIGPATIYHVGQNKHERKTILGNNNLLATVIALISILAGLLLIIGFRGELFEDVPVRFLYIGLALIPLKLFSQYSRKLLLGLQEIKKYNLSMIIQRVTFLSLLGFVLGGLKAGILGAIMAIIASFMVALSASLYWSFSAIGKTDHKINLPYIKDVTSYGIKAHLGNIIGFLNYRFDMFLVSAFLNPSSVGFYSIAVGMSEKLWLISKPAATVLFPQISSETDKQRRKEFTPIVSRNVFLITSLGALALYFLSEWVVILLYSSSFLPSIRPLQILLPGIVAMSVDRVLSNDLAGRGKPLLNTYMGLITVTTNISLNIIWIPKYGIEGAALASMIAYSIELIGTLLIYWHFSGNSPFITMIPQKSDLKIYKKYSSKLYRKLISNMDHLTK